MANTETYSIANDTLNGVVDVGSLHEEIATSIVSVELLGVSTGPSGGDDIFIDFVSAVTGADKTALDAVVASHTGDRIEEFLEEEDGFNLSVEDRDLNAPPTPDTDLFYIVGASPTGDWSGHTNAIASWNGNNWQFQVPAPGFGVWVKDESRTLVWTGVEWDFLGSDVVTNPFGTEYHGAQSTPTSTTTSIAWQTKVSLVTGTLQGGNYLLLVSYGWSSDTTSHDFEAQILQGQTRLGQQHKQEAKDSGGSNGSTGTDQRQYASRHFQLALPAGSHTFTFQHRTARSGNESSTWDAYMSLWKVA